MYKLLLAAGAASLALASVSAAEPNKNKGHGKQHASPGHMVQKGQAKHAMHTRPAHDRYASANWWGNRSCPPGLDKRNNGCLPPGIAKQSFNVGDRWNGNYGMWSYNQVPTEWRTGIDPDNRYYYRNGYLYSVDPSTRLVESVIRGLIR